MNGVIIIVIECHNACCHVTTHNVSQAHNKLCLLICLPLSIPSEHAFQLASNPLPFLVIVTCNMCFSHLDTCLCVFDQIHS